MTQAGAQNVVRPQADGRWAEEGWQPPLPGREAQGQGRGLSCASLYRSASLRDPCCSEPRRLHRPIGSSKSQPAQLPKPHRGTALRACNSYGTHSVNKLGYVFLGPEI